MRLESIARVITVKLLRKCRKRSQVDAIADFKHIEVVVADVHSQHIGYAGPVACCSAHPDYIVIAPLEVNIVIFHKEIHNLVGVRASVKYISDYMKSVNRKS